MTGTGHSDDGDRAWAPRWVKVAIVVVLVLTVLVVVIALAGVGGDHRPGRHSRAVGGSTADAKAPLAVVRDTSR
jgi:hypothetical protein